MFLSGLRKKSTITNSSELLRELQALGGTTSGASISSGTAMRQSTVYACVRVLSQTISSLPFHMYRKAGDIRERYDHNLVRLLAMRPNDWQTAQQFWAMADASLELRGNFYAFKMRGRGSDSPLQQLIPIMPDAITVEQKNDYSIVYKYTANGNTTEFTRADIFHVAGLSLNGYVGLNPIEWQRDTIGLAKAQETHGAALFKNGATPSGFVSHPSKFIDQEAIDRFREQWTKTYGGAEGAYKVAVLEQGMEWKAMTMNSQDSQWLESRGFQAQEICSIFGVPPWKVGAEPPKYSNAEQGQIQFVQEAIAPRIIGIEQAISTQLLTEREQTAGIYPKFNLDGLLRADAKTRAEVHQRYIQMGALSPNEVRAANELNPREGGDVYLTPVNMTTNPMGDNDTPADIPE